MGMIDTKARSDEEIEGDMQQALGWDRRVQPSDVTISIRRAIVTLTGTVDSLFKRWAAEDVARAVPGVLGIENEIEVVLPIAHERGDVDVALAVAHALALDPVLAESNVAAVVSRGRVTLEGELADPEKQKAAERIACQVFGVREVVNAIAVSETAAGAPALH